MNDKACPYLFVYGTLLDETNPYGIFLKENSAFFCEGRLNGELYDIGNYPGALLTDRPGNFVHGAVFKMNDEAEVLKELDDYEGFGDAFTQPNEFIRKLVQITTKNGILPCWIYLYNHPTSSLTRIYSGKYIHQNPKQ